MRRGLQISASVKLQFSRASGKDYKSTPALMRHGLQIRTGIENLIYLNQCGLGMPQPLLSLREILLCIHCEFFANFAVNGYYFNTW
jgi:hypothetical protein